MWWYRDKSKPDSEAPQDGAGPDVLTRALRAAMKRHSEDAVPLLAMSLLVDSRIELTDGTVIEGPSWFEAERCIEVALEARRPLRLYNQFSKDYGDGYSKRTDLPERHRKLLGELASAVRADPDVASLEPA